MKTISMPFEEFEEIRIQLRAACEETNKIKAALETAYGPKALEELLKMAREREDADTEERARRHFMGRGNVPRR